MESKMEFKAKMVGGKPVVEAVIERKINKDGGYDIIVHAPSLAIINKLGKE
jgi:hypothetical protein